MSKIKVDLKNDKESFYVSYLNYLDDLAQQTPVNSEIFTNKGDAHASILMATLLANTEHKINMYCQGLRPGILCGKNEGDGEGFEGAYWMAFKQFFTNTIKTKSDDFAEGSIRILIQNKQWLLNQPFQIVCKALNDVVTKNKIIVKLIRSEERKRIENILGDKDNSNYNFTTFDDKAFRLEYDPDEYKAMGSFNNPSWCYTLNSLFDYAFKNAEDITDEVKRISVN